MKSCANIMTMACRIMYKKGIVKSAMSHSHRQMAVSPYNFTKGTASEMVLTVFTLNYAF